MPRQKKDAKILNIKLVTTISDQLEQFCKARAIPCLIVPDAGHRLQFEDADKTQAVNRSITAMLR